MLGLLVQNNTAQLTRTSFLRVAPESQLFSRKCSYCILSSPELWFRNKNSSEKKCFIDATLVLNYRCNWHIYIPYETFGTSVRLRTCNWLDFNFVKTSDVTRVGRTKAVRWSSNTGWYQSIYVVRQSPRFSELNVSDNGLFIQKFFFLILRNLGNQKLYEEN